MPPKRKVDAVADDSAQDAKRAKAEEPVAPRRSSRARPDPPAPAVAPAPVAPQAAGSKRGGRTTKAQKAEPADDAMDVDPPAAAAMATPAPDVPAPAPAKRGRGKNAAAEAPAAASNGDAVAADDKGKGRGKGKGKAAPDASAASVDVSAAVDVPAASNAPATDVTATSKGRGKGKGKAALDAPAAPAVPDAPAAPAPDMKKVTIAFKGSRPVDAHCPGAASKHVYEANGVVYDVMLNQTNIGQNNNKFYVIQLLESDAGNTYFVFTRWGRVGVSGQQSIDSFKSLDSATSAFESKFKDKTANVWANRDSFVKKSGKYDMVHIDYATEEPAAPAEPQDKKPVEIPKSTLPDAVQSFIGFIADVKTMESTMLEMEYDATKAPLGKLTAVQIKNGYESLSRIANIIKHNSGNLMEACSEFYTRIPHNFGHRTPPLIRSEADVKRKQDLLGALGDIQIAMKLFQGDANKLGNPIDNHYASLKCDLVPLSESSPDWSLVTQYMSNTHASTHNSYKLKLLHLFKACRSGEDERFRPDIGNRQLLWHGSRSTNFVGILSTGLRIAPPEAPVTGYMFGKGIYFADMVSKSANYCFATGRPTAKGVLLLCEVALGEPHELKQSDSSLPRGLPSGKHSTKGIGRTHPDPSKTITLDDGVRVPLGKGVDSNVDKASLLYNEYIVYDIAQVRIRYVLQAEFDYGRG